MDSQSRSRILFHVTKHKSDAADAAPLPPGLRPALMAAYRRLNEQRHDYPIVLADGDGEYAVSLTSVIDGALRAVAPEGPAGEATRRRALQLETRVRQRVASGARGRLSAMCRSLADEMNTSVGDDTHRNDLATVIDAFPVDGELIACDVEAPARLIRHAWTVVQREKARSALARIDALVIRLGNILRADRARSPEALSSGNLQASFGPAHRNLFDFAAMSRLLNSREVQGGLSVARRGRIESALAALRSQQFFATPDAGNDALATQFVFDTTGEALDAFMRRLPEMAALHRALQVAELEAEGLYAEEAHDSLLGAIDEASLGATDLQFFPDFLVCPGNGAVAAQPALLEALSAGVPLKVLVLVDNLLEPASPGRARLASGLRGAQLGTAAMSLGEVFVLQTAASNLVRMRDGLQRGLRYAGPTLFVMYAGPAHPHDFLQHYLLAAAATRSRALPSFVYDPGAGESLSDRFSLTYNPQVERDWPVESLTYSDADLQAVTEDIAFTAVDFALCDPRHAAHFAVVPRSAWDAGMVPAAQWLSDPPSDPSIAVPFIVATDDADLMCRLVVDEQLMRAALRCREGWHRLQELGRVHEARQARALEPERLPTLPDGQSTETVKTATESSSPAEPLPPSGRDPDVACIETPRCSSCNECTLAFPKMFAYNDDKQAFIRDLRAGTYRQLVEAAESCQVSVIHPGKPWNPDEPGLEELIERARPFM